MAVIAAEPATRRCPDCSQLVGDDHYRCARCRASRRAVQRERIEAGVCIECRQPAEAFRCERCRDRRNARERERHQGIVAAEHWRLRREHEDGPDPAPARQLAELLIAAKRRRPRVPFWTAWDEALAVIVPAASWEEALAETKWAWRQAYVGYGRRLRLTPDPLDTLDGQRPGVQVLG